MRRAPVFVFLATMAVLSTGVSAGDDDYTAMLGYIIHGRPDRCVLVDDEGSAAVTPAPGDFGEQATVLLEAQATIAGHVLGGAHGLVSINQARGTANTQLDAVAVALASQGIPGTTDASLFVPVPTLAELRHGKEAGLSGEGTRSVAVVADTMRGDRGVLQLNPTVGSPNIGGNVLSLSVSELPR